jgi:hypothetical protein
MRWTRGEAGPEGQVMRRTLLLALTATALLAADQAMARGAKGDASAGSQSARASQSESRSGAIHSKSSGRVAYPRRHGRKALGGAQ